jgi:TonB family protein
MVDGTRISPKQAVQAGKMFGCANDRVLSPMPRFRSRILCSLGGEVRTFRLFLLFVVGLLAATSLSAQQAQDEIRPQKQNKPTEKTAELKAIKSPTVPYPEEALKKNVMGKVTLRIVVNAKGRVSDAEALSGPPELYEAALESVKQWEFEPPAHAPVVTNAEVTYMHEIDCPGPVSEQGEVYTSNTLRSAKGTIIRVRDDTDWPLPEYPMEDRKAGIAGEMVLSVTVNTEGVVEDVEVVKSLSPDLDKITMDTVRVWRFKLKDGKLDSLPDDFELHLMFRPVCYPKF